MALDERRLDRALPGVSIEFRGSVVLCYLGAVGTRRRGQTFAAGSWVKFQQDRSKQLAGRDCGGFGRSERVNGKDNMMMEGVPLGLVGCCAHRRMLQTRRRSEERMVVGPG